LRRILTIAWREFRHTALTKGFAVGVIAVPVLMLVMISIGPLLADQNVTPLVGTLAIADSDGGVAATANDMLRARRSGAPNGESSALDGEVDDGAAVEPPRSSREGTIDITIERIAPDTPLDSIRDRVRAGELVGLAVIPSGLLDERPSGSATLYVPPQSTPNHTMLLQSTVEQAVARTRVGRTGEDYERLVRLTTPATTQVLRLAEGGGAATEHVATRIVIPLVFMTLVWLSVFTSANYLLTTTIQEKSSRVIEVLLSAVSPVQLMAGKILGLFFVSLVMLVAYAGVGVAGLAVLASLDLIPLWHIFLMAICFVLAYFMVAAIMAGIGSAVNDLHEAQSLVTPAMLILVIPFVLWLPITERPNGMIAIVTTFIPPLTPFTILLRVTAANEAVALWQIVVGLCWGVICALGLIWLAGRVFRVGILMQGKTPSPRELLRWAMVR